MPCKLTIQRSPYLILKINSNSNKWFPLAGSGARNFFKRFTLSLACMPLFVVSHLRFQPFHLFHLMLPRSDCLIGSSRCSDIECGIAVLCVLKFVVSDKTANNVNRLRFYPQVTSFETLFYRWEWILITHIIIIKVRLGKGATSASFNSSYEYRICIVYVLKVHIIYSITCKTR